MSSSVVSSEFIEAAICSAFGMLLIMVIILFIKERIKWARNNYSFYCMRFDAPPARFVNSNELCEKYKDAVLLFPEYNEKGDVCTILWDYEGESFYLLEQVEIIEVVEYDVVNRQLKVVLAKIK